MGQWKTLYYYHIYDPRLQMFQQRNKNNTRERKIYVHSQNGIHYYNIAVSMSDNKILLSNV